MNTLLKTALISLRIGGVLHSACARGHRVKVGHALEVNTTILRNKIKLLDRTKRAHYLLALQTINIDLALYLFILF